MTNTLTDNAQMNLQSDVVESLNSLNLKGQSHTATTKSKSSYNRVPRTRSASYYYQPSTKFSESFYYFPTKKANKRQQERQQVQLIDLSEINPIKFELENELNLENDKFFVIKSFSTQDVYNSVAHKIWCSTENGNQKLNEAFKETTRNGGGTVYLFFSVNASGYFCGVAKMTSEVDFNWQPDAQLWSHSTKWKGKFNLKWIYVKNVPNRQLSYIKLENNENKPVTHSRDCQLVPSVNGIHIMKIIHYYHHYSSILDNYE